MGDYDVGYGKPPRATRFKSGMSGNPRGRPKRDPFPLGDIVNNVLDEPVQYHEKGRTHSATRREVALKTLVQRATNGDVVAAEMVLRRRTHALRRAGASSSQVLICDWLPDYPGQTAEQKHRDLGLSNESRVLEADSVSSTSAPPSDGAADRQETGVQGAAHDSRE
jgi:hypothetical protein